MCPADKHGRLNGLLLLMLLIAISRISWSAPITFNTALPVAKNEFILRQQFVVNKSGHDASGADRDLTTWSAISVLGYGVSSKLALFGVLPYVNKSLDITVSGQRLNRDNDGLGDVSLFGRYTAYQQDWPGRTLRIAPFAGFKAPTGKDDATDSLGRLPPSVQHGSGTWDTFGGILTTYQILDISLMARLATGAMVKPMVLLRVTWLVLMRLYNIVYGQEFYPAMLRAFYMAYWKAMVYFDRKTGSMVNQIIIPEELNGF
jgi:hypothetical protein